MISTDDEDGSERTGYASRYLVENNIMAYNSMGVVINLADKVDIYITLFITMGLQIFPLIMVVQSRVSLSTLQTIPF